nr:hypothetical protein Itr_chr01CG07910 [Ipomoea trifida]
MVAGGVKSDNGGQRLEKIHSQVFPFQSLRVSLVIPLICSNDGEGSAIAEKNSGKKKFPKSFRSTVSNSSDNE